MGHDHFPLDLRDQVPDDVTALISRVWGIALRNGTRIDDLEKDNEYIKIIFPRHITSVSTDFLEEFLGNIIIKLDGDQEELLRRFTVVSEGNYNFDRYLKDAIKRVREKEFA